MTLRYLLDTTMVIVALRRKAGPLRQRLWAESDRLAVSTITVSELAYGAQRSTDPSSNRRAVEQFLAFASVLPFTTAAAEHAGEIRALLAVASRRPYRRLRRVDHRVRTIRRLGRRHQQHA